eukprot:CAMPEP_0114555364 /NCGR_PEP_ID=MMETSP0114-20121206/8711_1 /TAXON_ID=31324 /ORGANISM="Goniomonas sp, Strain m" /LENGTH=104 /DNA_ID=CAMNT_0001740487 /DNA_START=63 /DNA_END=377 /DNA_ORIENTATION=+
MSTPLMVGLGVAAAALGARFVLRGGASAIKMPSLFKGGSEKAGFEADMSRKEAARILGLPPSARFEQIKEAHRKLMRLNHPDTGGSAFIATKINEAKEKMVKKG